MNSDRFHNRSSVPVFASLAYGDVVADYLKHTATEVAEAYFLSNFSKAAMGRMLGRSSIIIDGLFVRLNLLPPPRLIGKVCNRAALPLFKDGVDNMSACASADVSVTDLVDLLRFDLDLFIPLIPRS